MMRIFERQKNLNHREIKIHSVTLNVNSMIQAAERAGRRNPAGLSQRQAVLSDIHSDAAKKLRDGKKHFFFGIADHHWMPFLRWSEDSCGFDKGWASRGGRWDVRDDRAALIR